MTGYTVCWHTLSVPLSLVAKLCSTPVTLWTVSCQAPLSIGFSRQEYWSGLPFPSPGDLPNPGIKPRSLALQADSLKTELWEKLVNLFTHKQILSVVSLTLPFLLYSFSVNSLSCVQSSKSHSLPHEHFPLSASVCSPCWLTGVLQFLWYGDQFHKFPFVYSFKRIKKTSSSQSPLGHKESDTTEWLNWTELTSSITII